MVAVNGDCSRKVKFFAFIFVHCFSFHICSKALSHVRTCQVIGIDRWRNNHATVFEHSCLRGKIYPA